MTDPNSPRQCVAFALTREAMAFWDKYPALRRIPRAPCAAWLAGREPRTVLVLVTGLGPAAMEKAMRWVLGEPLLRRRSFHPQFVLLAGFSGALHPAKAIGDLVFASQVVDEQGGTWPASWGASSQSSIERGRVLTVERLVTEPADKRELGVRHDALVVDMESAVAARLCHEHAVPFGCLRAVSDAVDLHLSPALVGVLRAGRPSVGSLLALALRRPSIAGELWTLARNTRIAARRLGDAIDLLLRSAEAGGGD